MWEAETAGWLFGGAGELVEDLMLWREALGPLRSYRSSTLAGTLCLGVYGGLTREGTLSAHTAAGASSTRTPLPNSSSLIYLDTDSHQRSARMKFMVDELEVIFPYDKIYPGPLSLSSAAPVAS